MPATGGLANAVFGNTASIPQSARDYYAGKVNDIQELELLSVAVATLTSQTGRTMTGEPQCHAYLEHHQLGDQWR